MEWNGKWNGTEISVWNMEDARMEWNGDFKNGMEDNLPYFHTNSILNFVHCIYKTIYGWRVVINNIVTEVFNFNIYAYY